ncbi:SxtJ family membrane protein [Magnetococcales bacterium HHB-1]
MAVEGVRAEALKPPSDRSFGFVFTVVFAIVGSWPLLSGDPPMLWAYIVAAIFFLLAHFYAKALAPLNKLWTRFGLLLHTIMTPLIMGIMFFILITPIGLLKRLMGSDSLRLKFDKKIKSYWVDREDPGPAPETMKNQF